MTPAFRVVSEAGGTIATTRRCVGPYRQMSSFIADPAPGGDLIGSVSPFDGTPSLQDDSGGLDIDETFKDTDGLPVRGATNRVAPEPVRHGGTAANVGADSQVDGAPGQQNVHGDQQQGRSQVGGRLGGDGDDGSDSSGEDDDDDGSGQNVPMHENLPPIPDSEEHAVSFLGRLVIRGSEQEPPTGAACSTAVDYLAKLSKKQRAKYRGTVSIDLNMTVSASRTGIVCMPRGTPPEGHHGLACNLIHVTCVADHGRHMCFITAKLQPDRSVKFHAYAFVCESEYASRYLAEEVVRACRHVFMLRRIQRARQQANLPQTGPEQPSALPDSPNTQSEEKPKEPAAPREPDDADRLFYHEREVMEIAIRKVPITSVPSPKSRVATPRRGDGTYYDCCKNMGKCICSTKDMVVPMNKKASMTSVGSALSQTSIDPLMHRVGGDALTSR